MVNVGPNIHLTHGLLLAPMAGFSDAPFRRLCRSYGAEYTTTEMVSAQALIHHDAKTHRLADVSSDEMPCAVQIFGSDEKTLGEAADILLSELSHNGQPLPAALDINMGCPVRKIVSNGEGSALMQNPERCARIIEEVRKAADPLHIPVTAKIRIGMDRDHKNAPEVALALAQAGVSLITVHARTREQMYRPGIDLEMLRTVRETVPASIPVIGNGDIDSAKKALEMIRISHVDGVMIGRHALGHPWIFRQIASAMEGISRPDPTQEEILSTASRLLHEILRSSPNETAAVRECRGRLSPFLSGMPGSAAARDRLNRALTAKEAEEALRMLAESVLSTSPGREA